MGILSYIKNKKKDELVLVFDVGSSSVGGALFLMQESGIPKMIFSIRELIVLNKTFDPTTFLSSTLKSLDMVAEKIHTSGMGTPTRIFCVLSSPWYFSQTRVISFEKNTPFLFTPKFADSLTQKEINLFKEEHIQKYGHAGDSIRQIELKNIKTMLNGYETHKPLNQKAQELEMSIFISMSEEKVLNQIEEKIAHYFRSGEIKFCSFAMASFTAVRDIYTQNENFILIDVGGEVTDISMVKKNILNGSISFPLGCNFIIRGIADTLDSSLGEAQSFVSLLKDDHAAKPTLEKLDPVINKLKVEWLHKFQESLANITNDISVPSTIYISVDKELANFFCQTIENEQFNQYTLTESKFKVVFLGTEVFHGMAVFDDKVVRDAALIIDAIYINRYLK